jgi:hypothetical protein
MAKYGFIIYAMIALSVACSSLVFMGFGIFGITVFLYPSYAQRPAAVQQQQSPWIQSSPPSGSGTELLIRIVREVVHVNENGQEIQVKDREATTTILSPDEVDKLTSCVINAL